MQVPAGWCTMLAARELAGARLLAGIAWRSMGIVAAIGVVLFFLGAITSHLRVHDMKSAIAPRVLTLAAVRTPHTRRGHALTPGERSNLGPTPDGVHKRAFTYNVAIVNTDWLCRRIPRSFLGEFRRRMGTE
ncbi:DoxX family protein [Nocardia brevicatena]|uniref:DoxX family protein n=1 Tax=Nocardia brevicatena TaxID=37327 RepID=UPI0002F7F074|nr:DoxX family protein [Nocardia brevicatena]